MPTTIRHATANDHPRMLAIYNHFVEHEVSTFDLKAFDQLPDWAAGASDSGLHQKFVAVTGEEVVGWCVSSRSVRKPPTPKASR